MLSRFRLFRYLQVSEESVLADATGLHLGAGPYFLIYSGALTVDEESLRAQWPESVKVNSYALIAAPRSLLARAVLVERRQA